MRHNPAHFSPTSHICSNHTFKAILPASEWLSTPGDKARGKSWRQQVQRHSSQSGLTAAVPHPYRGTSRLLSPRSFQSITWGCWAHTIPAVPHSKPGLCISPLAQAGARFLPKAPLLVLLIPKAGREVEQCPQDQPEEPQVLSVHTLGVIHGLSPGLPHPHWHSSSFRVCFKLSTSMACCFPTAAVFQLPAHSERSNQDSCEPPLLLAPAVPKPVGVPAAQMFISAPSSSLSLFCLVYKDLT